MQLKTSTDTSIKGSIEGNVIQSALTQEQIIVLAMKQYASPFASTFKELLSNALDAHHVADVYSTPVDIFVDEDVTTKTIRIRFRDYGAGMSAEFLGSRYFALGDSTKRDDAKQTGSFGLGAKAGLIISPAMKVTTYTGDQSHTVIGQLVEGKQIVCSPVVTEPCSEVRGTLVELTIARSSTMCLASNSSVQGRFDLSAEAIMLAVQRTAVVGYIAGVDSAPRVRVTSNANYADFQSHSGHSLMKYYNRSRENSLLNVVKAGGAKAMVAENLTLVEHSLLSRPDYMQLDDQPQYWLWQDSFYSLAEGLAARIRQKTYKVDGEDVTFEPVSGFIAYWSVSPDVVFDISSDRTSINDTEHNSEIIVKLHRKSVAAMYRQLKNRAEDIADLIKDVDPFSIEYRNIVDTVNAQRSALQQFSGKYVLNIEAELIAAMRPFAPKFIVRSSPYTTRTRDVRYEGRRIDHGDEKLLPVVLVAEAGKNKPSQELIKAAVEAENSTRDVVDLFRRGSKREYKAFLVKCHKDKIQQQIAAIKAVVPKCIAVVSVDDEVAKRGIDLTVVRVTSGKPKVAKVRNKTTEMILYRPNSYSEPKDFAYQYYVTDEIKAHAVNRRLPQSEFTYVRVKSFDIDTPSRYLYAREWKTMDSISAMFGRQLLFLRSDVEVKEVAESSQCKLVELGTHMMNFYRTNLQAARQYRFWQQMMYLSNYPHMWLALLQDERINVKKLVKDYLDLDFEATKMNKLLQWRRKYEKVKHPRDARHLAHILGFRHPINASETAVIWSDEMWKSTQPFHTLESAIERHWPAGVANLDKVYNQFTSSGRLCNLSDNYTYAVTCGLGSHGRSLGSITSMISGLVRDITKSSCAESNIEKLTNDGNAIRQNKKARKLLELALARYFAW